MERLVPGYADKLVDFKGGLCFTAGTEENSGRVSRKSGILLLHAKAWLSFRNRLVGGKSPVCRSTRLTVAPMLQVAGD